MCPDTDRGDAPTGPEDGSSLESVATPPRLSSRILMTWFELTLVGLAGGFLGAAVEGPPGFVIYLAASLLTVGIVLHNVNELVKGWLRASSTRAPE
ncbi:hypothetical protein SAMN05444422_104220 [Halobiforma haloterrestris]|uniref:Uncharacterized protein n=1 Tax=Natronobacterium haloterrestre TaxID=148448 RepID=A0A1I1GH72_NATHA|nr:hypothetical protein [Halobiforma haloterrestris]SFC09198.1 hypothetical protein SAMN05444422_104220 [Halobiforma haloterrestris]